MDRKTAILAGLPIFSKLDQRSLEAVGTLAREVSLPAGSVLMQEGEPADAFFVIVTGVVRVERQGQFVRSMSDGGFLGEIAMLEGSERTATATCATDGDFLRLGSFEFGRLMARFPDIRERVETALTRRPHGSESA